MENIQSMENEGQKNIGDLKIKTINFVFETARKGCGESIPVSEFSWETDFTEATRLCVASLNKYTPKKIRSLIKAIYSELDTQISEIDSNSGLNDKNKLMYKKQKAHSASLEVLEFLFLVMVNSPLNTEFITMDIKDYGELAKVVRNTNKLELFSPGDDDDE
jgi:hypothetical protein